MLLHPVTGAPCHPFFARREVPRMLLQDPHPAVELPGEISSFATNNVPLQRVDVLKENLRRQLFRLDAQQEAELRRHIRNPYYGVRHSLYSEFVAHPDGNFSAFHLHTEYLHPSDGDIRLSERENAAMYRILRAFHSKARRIVVGAIKKAEVNPVQLAFDFK